MYKSTIAGIALHFILFGSGATAQEDRYGEPWRWVHFTTESGLPSNRVTNLVETEDTVIWVETSAGIAWYDGFQWHKTAQENEPSGPDGTDLYATRNDSVLFLRYDSAVSIGNRNGFRSLVTTTNSRALPFRDNEYLTISRGSIFIDENGVRKVFDSSRKPTKGKTITLFGPMLGGTIWANLVDGLYRWEGDDWKLQISSGSRPLGPNYLAENANKSGLAFIETPFDRRGLWEWSDGSLPAFNRSEPREAIRSLDVSPDGEAIVLYESGNVRMHRGGKWFPFSFNGPEIRDILFFKYRPNGDLWVGTEHGLFLYNRSSTGNSYWSQAEPKDRVEVNEILRCRDGTLWLATGDGLEIHQPGGGVRRIGEIEGTVLHTITGLAEDGAGNIWISSGSSFPGAFRWDGISWTYFRIAPDSAEIFVHKIRTDRRGRAWFVGLGKYYPTLGLNQPGAYVLADGKFTKWGVEEGLLSGRVYAVAEGADGALWFGTIKGLSRWKPGSVAGKGKWTHWTQQEGLAVDRVFTVVVDHNNRTWFLHQHLGTPGVGTIDDSGRVSYLTTADGLVDDKVWDLRVGPSGELWLATNGGLSSYDGRRWTSFDKQSGLLYTELWPVLPTEDHVYVGTRQGGLAILDRRVRLKPPPRIVLSPPIVEGTNVLLRWNALSYWGEASPGGALTRYRIDDGAWSGWTKKYEFTLASLRSGDHAVQVQAKGILGNFDETGGKASFSIAPPLYLRPVILVPVSLLVSAVVILVSVNRRRRRKYVADLQRSEAKFRAATEHTSSAIFIYHDPSILFVNWGASALTGYDESELGRMNFGHLVHPDDRGRYDALESGKSERVLDPNRAELRMLTKEGRERWVELTVGSIHYQDLLVSIATAFDIDERKHAEENLILKQEQLRSLATDLSLTEERERRRMATYLHDVIGQALLLSKMKLREILKHSAVDGMAKPVDEVRELIDQSIAHTRSLTYELCPPVLYELRFESAIRSLAEQTLEAQKIDVVFEDDGAEKPLRLESKIVLFHCLKEVLHNIVKHAEATQVRIRVARDCDSIALVVEDDGRGIDAGAQTTAPGKDQSFGLFNVRERLSHLGGSFTIGPGETAGTRAVLRAPVDLAKP